LYGGKHLKVETTGKIRIVREEESSEFETTFQAFFSWKYG
jgi:hypothetical protein